MWPKSLGIGSSSGAVAYTDCHNLHLSDNNYNSNRGNKYFDDCGPSCTEKVTEPYGRVGGPR